MDDARMTSDTLATSPPPAIAVTLERIDRRLAHLEQEVDRVHTALRGAPTAIAAAVDTFDDVVAGLASRGVDVDERLTTMLQVLDRLTRPAALDLVRTMLDRVDELRFVADSGLLEPSAVGVVARLGRALASSSQTTGDGVGLFGALRAMSNPDVQRAVGFVLALAQTFGAGLRDQTALPAGGGR